MTDRYDHITIALDRDIREDDAEVILSALRCIKGVAAVSPHVRDATAWAARERARQEIEGRIIAALRND